MEAAFVLPAMVFFILVMLQMTVLSHVRIMTEYAAFSAARAGVVFNGDQNAMKQAALVALAPTIGRTDTEAALASTVNGSASALYDSIPLETAQRAQFGLPIVQLTVLNPTKGSFNAVSYQLGSEEIDFDDIRQAATAANQLQIELHYYYHMRIPFANQILQALYFAQVSAQGLLQNGWNSGGNWLYSETDFVQQAQSAYAGSFGGAAPGGTALVPESSAIANAARSGYYYFPFMETYTMRMQSNFYLKNTSM